MKRIAIENARPGQILAQKIQRADGALWAGQGSEVSEGLLRMLARLNIESIVIEEENKLSQPSDRLAAKREVRRIKNLPTLPGVVTKISRMVENPETSAAAIGRLIK